MRNRTQKNVVRYKRNADRAHERCISHIMRHHECDPFCPVAQSLSANVQAKAEIFRRAYEIELERRKTRKANISKHRNIA